MLRKTLFIARGLKSFTLRGYEQASRHFDPADLPASVAGRGYLVTGANSGIGYRDSCPGAIVPVEHSRKIYSPTPPCPRYEIARAILQREGTVYMVCRNAKLAEEVRRAAAFPPPRAEVA